MASKIRDAPAVGATGAASRPLNARSLALSALLGTHPPRLPAHGLVALAEAFGMRAGAMRTALSRMVATGDVVNDEGTYTLTARLAGRQAAQDTGRRAPTAPWDGRWHTAVATVDHRALADRRRIRTVFADARFGELRPDTWMRPANLPAPALGDEWVVTTGSLSGTPTHHLVQRLWALDDLATTARRLLADLEVAAAELRDELTTIRPAFEASARVVRFLRSDPLLPDDVLPADWPVPVLRRRYDDVEAELQVRLRPILRGDA